MDYGGGDHQNWQVRDAYGCSVAGQIPVAAGLAYIYRPIGCIPPRCLLDCDNSSAAAAVAACRAICVMPLLFLPLSTVINDIIML